MAQLLAVAPNLTVLTTSRAPLRLTAEHAYRVLPLAVANAAALFTARVAATRSGLDAARGGPVVAEICARLDGLPLAIELAADRARLLPLPTLLERLERRLELLSGGPRDLPERQRSLRATLEWSWEVLEPAERTLLARLCVFEGGASLEAFDAVCNPEGEPAETLLAAIMDKTSLVVVEAGVDSQPRLAMLDTVREFAAEQVAAGGEMILLELRHAQFFLAFAERAAEQAARADRRVWLSQLALERGNLRVAFERLLRMGRPRTRCGSRSRSHAPCPGTRTRTSSATGSKRRSRGSRPSRARGAPRRSTGTVSSRSRRRASRPPRGRSSRRCCSRASSASARSRPPR